jgi:hypothetical protein
MRILFHGDTIERHAVSSLHFTTRGLGLRLITLSWPLLIWSGLTAFVFSTWLLMLLRKVNATRYLPRAYWSCALTGSVGDFALMFGGLVRTVAMVAVFPIIYAMIFTRIGRAEAVVGLIIGLVHGLVAGLALPLAARRCEGAHPPGLLGWHLGRITPIVMLVVHGAYGAILGYVYVIANG